MTAVRFFELEAKKIAKAINGKVIFDETYKVWLISSPLVVVAIKGEDSEWLKFPNLDCDVICAESATTFDMCKGTFFAANLPFVENRIDNIIRIINMLHEEPFVSLSDTDISELNVKNIELIEDMVHETEFYENVLNVIKRNM